MSLSENSAVSSAVPFLSLSPSESEIYQAVGDWISAVLGDGFNVIQGQQNQSPPPLNCFVTMVISNKERLATNGRHYTPDQKMVISDSSLFTIQVACVGKGSGEAISTLKTLWRDLSCCQFFIENLPSCAPVSSDNPVQEVLTTAENQYENRWSVGLRLNVLTEITLNQDSFSEIHLTTLST
ncbi:hypothetical protein FAI40_04610 [Acetobacteraceae bacterium]|nr:hypothetical protein FAI40_04610 [Acetobacteraceae bacterium]